MDNDSTKKNAKNLTNEKSNKYNVEERIKLLFDENSFVEIGSYIREKNTRVITGYGTVSGKLVYAYAFDYELNGGVFTKKASEKICNIMDMAAKMGAPIVKMYDSIGSDLSENLDILLAYGKLIDKSSKFSGVIPQISIVYSACSGLLAVGSAISDFNIVINESSQVYLNDPKDVIVHESKYIDSKSYGNALNLMDNGTAQILCDNEKQAISLARKLVSYLPSNNLEFPIDDNIDEDSNKKNLQNICQIENLSEEICDTGTLININNIWNTQVDTNLGKIGGIVVGIIESREGAKLTIRDVNKIGRFVKVCDCFNIPIVSLVDCKGFLESIDEEKQGFIMELAKTFTTITQATVPKLAIIVGKAFGGAYTLLSGKESTFDLVCAWPESEICIMEPKKLLSIFYRDEILESDIPKRKENDIFDEKTKELTDIYRAAEKGYVDNIIEPPSTKDIIINSLSMMQSKREINYPKKHGSVLI
ncbi:carboxyl transferase domain-containing protein [Clostridium rectalis]|uniref:carboxyl transferase domain-containing protein n=1 Tax=Clostridium rectalis TaxID=2040295 RepID=UPI000F63AC42|nr:carboxyl transferase domain-containing protein [Clostridium rectalis]